MPNPWTNRIAAILVASVLTFGFSQSGPENLVVQWQDALNAGDAAEVAALYTEDSWFRHASGMVTAGRGEIEAWAQGAIGAGLEFSVAPGGYELVSDTIGTGYGAWSATNADGQVVAAGEYLTVEVLVDDQWLTHRMFSGSLPLTVE